MSRGPGKVERALAAVFDAEPDNAFTVEELCERVYPGLNRVEKKHRVSVLRAAMNLMKRRKSLDRYGKFAGWWQGNKAAFFNRDSALSKTTALYKAENRYRSNDRRVRKAGPWGRDGRTWESDIHEKLETPEHRHPDEVTFRSVRSWRDG